MNIQNLIERQIQEDWKSKSKILKEKIKESYERLNATLAKQKGDTEDRGHGFGEFANDVLDSEVILNIMSRKKGKGLPPDRAEGIIRAKNILEKYLDNNFASIPKPTMLEYSWSSEVSFLSAIEDYYMPFSEIFLALRIADFEKNASYVKFPEVYKKEKLSWGKIMKQEWEMVPVFVAWEIHCLLKPSEMLSPLTTIASKIFPVKLVMIENELPIPDISLDEEEYIASMLPTDLALLVPGLQKIHYFQAPAELENRLFGDKIKQILSGMGTALIRVYTGNLQENQENYAYRAALCRYLPWFEYNPHRDFSFTACISLDGNSHIDDIWGKDVLGEGQFSEERVITFADFVCQQGFASRHFSEPSAQERKRPMDMAEYLELETWNRQHYYPVVKDLSSKPKIPSKILVALSAERAKIWKTLQNWAGIDRPLWDQKVEELKSSFKVEKDKALSEQEKRLTTEKERESKEILSKAFQNLVVNLLTDDVEKRVQLLTSGLSVGEVSIPPVPTQTSTNGNGHSATAIQEKVETKITEAWVESKLCTACDECVTINRSIFAYNQDKQAYIKNPKGGPFKDIVKAAEKCSAGIIHPGKPLDPNEKDLEKLTKRAEKYN
ncbi:MAG: ferredoxin [Leptospiraceae bacterium]|nr:ferredoxin [Leptospiraceae bacterium]